MKCLVLCCLLLAASLFVAILVAEDAPAPATAVRVVDLSAEELGLMLRRLEATASRAVDLFAETRLDAWDFYLADDGKKDETFRFESGVLHVSGKPFGWLGTRKEYKNFRFDVEYRWPAGAEPTNSGIFLRINGEPINFLPRGIEIQLKHGNGGDLYGFHAMRVAGEASRYVENLSGKQSGELRGVKRHCGAESPAGEWNRVSIVCYEGLLVVKWNGTIVNWAHDTEGIPGKIGFQSEGGPIEFRRAMVEELDAPQE